MELLIVMVIVAIYRTWSQQGICAKSLKTRYAPSVAGLEFQLR